jgi:hypothetical protein
MPPLELQNSKSEYPRAAVGTTKGKSAKVSRMGSHRDFPRVISQAKGTPASKSKAATIKPIMNELEIAPEALFSNTGLSKRFCIVPAFVKIPIIGGIRIIAKKIMIAEI